MTVSVEYSEEVAFEPFECEGDVPGGTNPCGESVVSDTGNALIADFFTFYVWGDFGFSGWYPVIEVDPDNNTARVCTAWYSDVEGPQASCPIDRMECATAGTLLLSAKPELGKDPVRGYIDVEFSTFSLQGSFSYARAFTPRAKRVDLFEIDGADSVSHSLQ
jgi:hypothetical protein